MSGGTEVGVVDLIELLSEIDRVCRALMGSFLVRNWCGTGAPSATII
jgi:hypothetical protein